MKIFLLITLYCFFLTSCQSDGTIKKLQEKKQKTIKFKVSTEAELKNKK